MSEQSSIVHSIRLPKDPPRTFDINRCTLRQAFASAHISDMDKALTPICKLVGLPDFEYVKCHICTPRDWSGSPERSRVYHILYWLLREDELRSGKK